jgi:hypothetical protein
MCLVISGAPQHSTSISLAGPSQNNKRGLLGSLVGVAVSKEWSAQVDRSFVEANDPRLEDQFAGAYPGEQWGNQARGFRASAFTDPWRDGDGFRHLVDFLGREDSAPIPNDFLEIGEGNDGDLIDFSDDLIDFSADLIDFSEDLIDFSDNLADFSKPVDDVVLPLVDWRETISDEEFMLDELMVAVTPDSQDGSKAGLANVMDYLEFDEISFDASDRIINEKPLAVSHFSMDEELKKIAEESARIGRLIRHSSPELILLPDPEFVPSVPKSILGMTGYRLLRAEVKSG